MPWREPAPRPTRCRRELDFDEIAQLAIELAGLGDPSQNVLPASDMHPAFNRNGGFSQHQGTAFADLLEVAGYRFRYTATGDLDQGH